MYSSRQNAVSQSNQLKFSVPDACERIKDELTFLQQQCHKYELHFENIVCSFKVEYEKSLQEKNELQRHYVMYYEITYGLNIEMHKQHQSQVAAAVERAKQVTLSELNSIISQQLDDFKYPKLSSAGLGISVDQLEFYKLRSYRRFQRDYRHRLVHHSPLHQLPQC
ncbi:unnamed protein product [Dibothriocephalus latus]|uniref:Groucho/TLE N-terminal Q-rich domain-containing protein n=1 Tax=Dibothriocephalus latus TaxID=60516 RepID=A0A3P7PGC4_DIBLA|nr:unnamed protein product [Dibothriocephalus latus]